MYIPISYNPAYVNDPPTATLTFDNEYLYLGQLVTLRGNSSFDPEGSNLIFNWRFISVPNGSQVSTFTPVLPDYSTVTFVPDVVGIYQVELTVSDGVLSSDPVNALMVARQLPVPHGQSYEPDMRFLFNFVRDWILMIEDRDKIAVLWSAYAQILSEVLLRVYETNLGKSIATVPELLQWRWRGYRLRVDLPDSFILTGGVQSSGTAGRASTQAPTAVILERPVNVTKGRVIIFDGQARTVIAPSTRFPYQDLAGTQVEGTRVGLSQSVDSGARHVRWWLCSGTLRYDVDTMYQLRCYAGDLMQVDLEIGSRVAPVLFRVYGVTSDGYVGFEFTPGVLSDDYDYFINGQYKREVLAQIETAFISLGLDPGQFTYAQLAARFIDLCRVGNFTKIQNDFGISLRPRNILRLSRYKVDDAAVAVPYLQSAIRNPVFVLRENEDFIIQEDDDGRFIQLASSVVLDEADLPRSLWAEVTYIDNAAVIENNFGLLVGGERDNLPSRVTGYEKYRGAVAGLMYAFCTGPTPDNIRLGVQIVLGLPFTAEKGYVRLVDNRYSAEEGLIVIEDANQDDEPTGFQRIYRYPLTAELEINPDTGQAVKVGDLLPRFFPLCTGVEIRDWVNTPDWWTPLYDGAVALPEPHEAFYEYGWNPGEEGLWPEEALKTFEESQKIHIFEVRLDAATFAVEDVQFAARFVRGVNQTWRLGLEKKGIRPHYTYPLFVVTLEFCDQIRVRDRVTLSGQMGFVDDGTGYEFALMEGDRNASGALLLHSDGAPQASRTAFRKQARFVPPEVNGVTAPGGVRLDLDVYNGAITAGQTLTGSLGATAEVVEIVAADPSEAPVTHIALVTYTSGLFREYDRLTGPGGEATIVNECPACIRFNEHLTAVESDPDSYNIARYRDMLLVEEGPWSGRYGVFRVDRSDTQRLVLHQLRTDNPSHNPPTPYGTSDPGGSSSYRPEDQADRDSWQTDTTEYYCQLLRPYSNPVHSPEIYITDPARSRLGVVAGGLGFHDTAPTDHFHTDNIRAGYIATVINPGGDNHLDEFEVVRATDATTQDEITAAELEGWRLGAAAPGLRIRGPAIPSVATYDQEVHDPRLPYTKPFSGVLPSQAGIPDNFTVLLPPTAAGHDGAYVGMYFRARSGSGAYDPGVQEGHWYVVAYDGTTKEATLARNHRNVFDDTTVFELVSFRTQDQAIQANVLHDKFPGSLLEHSFLAAVKSTNQAAAPEATASVVSGSPVVTVSNIGNVAPGGKDFVTPNVGGDAPFEAGPVQVGDQVILSPTVPADRGIASQVYTVTGNILADSFEVSPTPADTSVAPMYFTVYRAAPTVYAWDGVSHVVGSAVLYTPVPEWSIW